MSHQSTSHQTTYLQTLMHLLNGYIGTGILVMPKAFADGGILVSSICTPIVGLLTNACIHMLIDINDLICKKLNTPRIGDYGELAEKTMFIGPKWIQRYSKIANFFVTLFLVLIQIGGCSVYNLFIADNIKKFCINLNLFSFADMSVEWYLLIIWPFLILINFVKSIKHLSYASTLANTLYFVGLCIIFYNLFSEIPGFSNRGDISMVGPSFPLYFSTTVFTFEGITVAMPLYQAMKEPKNFGKILGVINVAIIVIIILYFAVGFFGYFKYGDGVAASITLSLPSEPLYDSVQLMCALAVACTYPILLYVAIDMLWPLVRNKLQEKKFSKSTVNVSNYVFRALLVTSTFALAAAIPRLDLIIALVGAFSSSSIAIIIPTILHTIAFWEEKSYSRSWLIIRNGIIGLIGCAGLGTGTYYSLVDIIDGFKHGFVTDSIN